MHPPGVQATLLNVTALQAPKHDLLDMKHGQHWMLDESCTYSHTLFDSNQPSPACALHLQVQAAPAPGPKGLPIGGTLDRGYRKAFSPAPGGGTPTAAQELNAALASNVVGAAAADDKAGRVTAAATGQAKKEGKQQQRQRKMGDVLIGEDDGGQNQINRKGGGGVGGASEGAAQPQETGVHQPEEQPQQEWDF